MNDGGDDTLAALVNAGGKIETPSADGSSTGSCSIPMTLYNNTANLWMTKRYNQVLSGKAPQKPLKNDSDIIWEGSLQLSWALGKGGLQPDEEREKEKADVALEGCSELGEAGQSFVTASGRPADGSYRFWAEPQAMFAIESGGATATLGGAEPGRGTVHVEYTSPKGKVAQKSRPAACVRVASINAGQAIPKIGLFDIDGKRTPGVRSVPVAVLPADAADLLVYDPADPGVLTAVNLGDSVQLQGIREGKTTFQARMKCTGATGPVAAVEVVPCDDETVAMLTEMKRIAEENLRENLREIQRIIGASGDIDIVGSTGDLLIKTGGLIIGSLSGEGAIKVVQTAGKIYGYLSSVRDFLLGDGVLEGVSNSSQLFVQLKGSPEAQTLAGVIETLLAATKFGKDLGNLIGAAERLESAHKEFETSRRVVEDLARRQSICRIGTGQPPRQEKPPGDRKQPPPPTEPPPKPDQPPPKTDVPPATTDVPPGEESPGEKPPPPPPPTNPPRQVGLPYSPGECGCGQTREIGSDQMGLASLKTGMGNLKDCVEKFSDGPLAEYRKTLEEIAVVIGRLGAASKAGGVEWPAAAKDSLPGIESLLGRTKSFDDAGRKFYEGFKSCPGALEAGSDVMSLGRQ